MSYIRALGAGLTCVVLVAGPASAHVTVQPNEAIVGSFSRFVVRVPTERPDASTTKVEVRFPPLAFVSFEPKEGWKRDVKMVELDEPIEAFGQEITESVGSVTWTGGRIGPGEFDEFGFSARMPDGEETLVFEAVQTYSSGEVVKWTGEADSETPAAELATYDVGVEEGEGELAALAELRHHVEGLAAPPTSDDENDGSETMPLILGGAALVVSLVALALAWRGRGT
jgi:periplasmic copper chaperone A